MRFIVLFFCFFYCAFSLCAKDKSADGGNVAAYGSQKDYYKRQGSLSFKWDKRGRMLVPVAVAGLGDKYFLFDSGAGGTTLHVDQARLAGLTRQLGKTQQIVTATGVEYAGLYKVGGLSFGLRKLRRPALAALPSEGEVGFGVLGLDLILWQVFEVYPAHQKIHLYQYANHFEKKKNWQQAEKGDSRGNAVFIKLYIGGQAIEAMIDTGASVSILNTAAANKAALTIRQKGGKAMQRIIRGTGTTMVRGTDAVGAVGYRKQGQLLNAEQRLIVADLPAFKVIGKDKEPFMLLGMDILRQLPFVLDMRHSRLFYRLNMKQMKK